MAKIRERDKIGSDQFPMTGSLMTFKRRKWQPCFANEINPFVDPMTHPYLVFTETSSSKDEQ